MAEETKAKAKPKAQTKKSSGESTDKPPTKKTSTASKDASTKAKSAKPKKQKEYPFEGTLNLGDTGPAIEWMQGVIGCEVTGVYDKCCRASVQRWQSLQAMATDGIVGPKTWQRVQIASRNK